MTYPIYVNHKIGVFPLPGAPWSKPRYSCQFDVRVSKAAIEEKLGRAPATESEAKDTARQLAERACALAVYQRAKISSADIQKSNPSQAYDIFDPATRKGCEQIAFGNGLDGWVIEEQLPAE